jgi:RHS repeat-associated protein
LFSHADHLNTPRLVADATGTTVWRWDQAEPFGNNPANEDPDGNSVAFDLPLRLPGQRYDAETGLHYNYFRDYDPSLGRYGESDPIGLLGALNTYGYADGNPTAFTDVAGLQVFGGAGGASGSIGGFGGLGGFGGRTSGGGSSSSTGSRELDEAMGMGGRSASSSGTGSGASSSSSSSSCPPDDDPCEQLNKIDTATCNGITRRRGPAAGAICHASASQRLGECRKFGISGVRTPLATWNN